MTLPRGQDSGKVLPIFFVPAGRHGPPHFSAWHMEALRDFPRCEAPALLTQEGKARSEPQGPLTLLPQALPLVSDPGHLFTAGLIHTHLPATSLQGRMSSPACFFLVPGRPIRWALKIALGPTGRPGPGQQLRGQQSWATPSAVGGAPGGLSGGGGTRLPR